MKFKEIAETSNGSKNFLKLKDKESVVGIFRGSLHDFYCIWENGKSREVLDTTPGGSFRFRVNFVVKDGSNYVVKIFENGIGLYKQLAELHAEYNLEETVVKITRNGTGTDTTYSILPLLKQQLTKEAKSYLEKLELLPLENKQAPGPDLDSNGEEIPF